MSPLLIAIACFIAGIGFGILNLLQALIEIEAEGKFGWAQKLLTYYREPQRKWLWLSGKPVTGYHIFLFSFFFTMFHVIPYGVGLELTWRNEGIILSMYFLFTIIEDAMWFILNPYYGWKNIHKAWWVPKKFMGLPKDYWFAITLSALTGYFSGIEEYLSRVTGIVIVIILCFAYREKYVNWYFEMRKKDDRHLYNIIVED